MLTFFYFENTRFYKEKSARLVWRKVPYFIILFVKVIQALVNLVNEPEPDHPLRADLAGNISYISVVRGHKKVKHMDSLLLLYCLGS